MYTRESVSTDRYHRGDDSGSGRDEPQNTTAVSSDWSVRPSDDAAADSTQPNSLSRLNPAAAPFSFPGGNAAAAAAGPGGPGSNNGDLVGAAVGGVGGSGGLHHPHHSSMLSGSSMDGGVTPPGMAPSRGGGGLGLNGSSNNNNINGNSGAVMGGMDVGGPNSFGVMQGMMSMPYGMVGGHRPGPLTGGRPVGMIEFGGMHGAASAGGPMGGGGGMSVGNAVGRMGGGITSPNSFLPPPGEDTDQQELLRLQQTNYRVKMLPPPLTYEVHRKIWSKNEYGDDNDDEAHGSAEQQEEESLHSLMNEDPIDKEQRLEAYKQIMLRWYSHIHVLEGKSEVAKRLVRVRRSCPSMEEVIASLSNQQLQQPSGAATTTTGSEGGDDDASVPQQQLTQQPAAAATTLTRRSPSEPLDTEEVLASWSAQCWDWWQETVKRKPRRARKQGELPLGMPGAPGLPTSASVPMVGTMGGNGLGDGGIPHSLSARAMDMEVSSPHLNGGSPFNHHSPYTNLQNGSAMDAAVAMPMAPSYPSFTDLSEEGAIDAVTRSVGQNSQQQPQQQQLLPPQQLPSRPSSQLHGVNGQFPPHHHHHQQQQPQQQSSPSSHNATPPASMFTTNGIRAAAPRSGNTDDFLENDHLALAFTTELLKSLED